MSLHITHPFGRVFLSSILAIILISGCSEVLARNTTVESILPIPTINGHPLLATKLMLLDAMVAESGPPDCILVGSSMIDTGIDPTQLSDGYQHVTGEALSCFNFGLTGVAAQGTERLSRILIQKYHPRLLIYGLNFRDFVDFEHPMDNAWTRYYLGEPSLEGWLSANSYAYRYGLTYRNLLRQNSLKRTTDAVGYRKDGFLPKRSPKKLNLNFPDNNVYIQWSNDYQILPDELKMFDELLQLDSPEHQIIIVEMPLAPGLYDNLPNGEHTHQVFINVASSHTSAQSVPFITTQDVLEYPNGSWYNATHLNTVGASVFSKWLGGQIAGMVQSNELYDPAHK